MRSTIIKTKQSLLLMGASVAVLGLSVSVAQAVAVAEPPIVSSGSLVISSSTYDNTQGAVKNLQSGVTQLANTDTATITAVAGNDYVNVWNNDGADGSFGVTSPITLTAVNPSTSAVLSTLAVPTAQVVTSFSSKSELALHVTKDNAGNHLVFVAYGGAGVGALDVSNSDAVAGQDPTNPVTYAFGSSYAFPRTIVSLDATGNLVYTPTINYGGNNGRAALLGSNGLYYTVGNANNGNAKTYGPPYGTSNGTSPDVTLTTGLQAVNPINGSGYSVAIPSGNSHEVYAANASGPLPIIAGDKPGKDYNFRGIAEYGGALYFTKGSGSNGVQTVYSVNTLPSVATAGSTPVSIVPGFPTDSAKAKLADGTSGGNFTPFAVFFANYNTMYVTDEGSGNSTDVASHGGLQKWSLVGGTWVLDYVLTNGLIGASGTPYSLTGSDGTYPASGKITTTGLRNLTGVVNKTGTVTLWATTSTASSSGDNGADPNMVVKITDILGATSKTGLVANEKFVPVAGPTYGTVYRGVAYVP